jgi:hypothetical protein
MEIPNVEVAVERPVELPVSTRRRLASDAVRTSLELGSPE